MRLQLTGLDRMMDTLESVRDRGLSGSVKAMEATMAEAEADAKRSAPWTDRTGNARNSIGGYTDDSDKKHPTGILSIGMFYGVFLELKNAGKYRIVWPTLEIAAQRLPLWMRKYII